MTNEKNSLSQFEIGILLGKINAKLDEILKNNVRLMVAMLGIIAAGIGVKFIGTPLITEIAAYAAFICSVFLVSTAFILIKRRVHWARYTFRIVMAAFVMFSVFGKSVIFKSGHELAPLWYAPVIDCFFIVLCVLLIIATWRNVG